MRRLVLSVILLMPLSSIASTPLQKQIADCASVLDAQSRLSCYDKVAANLRVATSSEPTSNGVTALPSTSAAVATATASVAATAVAGASAAPAAEPEPAPLTREQMEQEFGLEHKKDYAEERPNKLPVMIAKKKRDPYGRWRMTLDNGQVWKQTDSRKFRFSNDQGEAFIKRGSLGSFFLGEEEHNRTMKVKRVK